MEVNCITIFFWTSIMEFLLLLGAGIMIIIGTYKEWKFFVDPPDFIAYFPKKIMGKEFIVFGNYLLGIVFILYGLFRIWNTMNG